MDQAARYSVQERIKIVEACFVTKSVVQTQRQFRWDFPGKNAPARLTLKRLLDKFRQTWSVQNNIKGRSGQPRSVRTENHIMTDCETLFGAVSKEIHKTLSHETDLSSLVVRVMHQESGYSPVSI